jgi:predicted sulfurtransferase
LIEELADLNNVRFQIVKSMLAEFPKLKIRIRKEIIIESLNSKEGIPIQNYLARVIENSKRQYERVSMRNDMHRTQKSSVPLWATLPMSSIKKNQKGKGYYVFK